MDDVPIMAVKWAVIAGILSVVGLLRWWLPRRKFPTLPRLRPSVLPLDTGMGEVGELAMANHYYVPPPSLRSRLAKSLSARGLLIFGVIILTMSVFGFVQSSSELQDLRARSNFRYTGYQRQYDMQQLFRSLSAAGLVVGVSTIAAGLYLGNIRRSFHIPNPRDGE